MGDVRDHLRALADAAPVGSMLTVPRDWIVDLVGPTTAPMPVDLTVPQLAARFGRSASTVRWWIECQRFPGAYRLRGREWRVPPSALAAFEAAERDSATGKAVPALPTRSRPSA